MGFTISRFNHQLAPLEDVVDELMVKVFSYRLSVKKSFL